MSNFSLIAIIGIIFGILFHAYTGQVEKRVIAEIEAKTQKIARDYENKTAKMSMEQNEILNQKNAEILTIKATHEREINDYVAKLEKSAIKAPFETGNDFERRIALSMCLISKASDSAGRDTCHLQARQTFAPDTANFITVTASTSEQWREYCEDGKLDYCNYAIIGLTTEGARKILLYLDDVDRYQYQLNARSNTLETMIDKVVEIGEDSKKK